MATFLHPSTTLANKSASEFLRSFSNGITGLPLKDLGRTKLGVKKRDLSIFAKIRKGKKHDYPWPDEIDPNVKGGYLSYLSHFKPLKEKPKPVTLAFEKPLMDLEKKIIDVRRMADETGLDFSDQIASLENKYQQALKDLYTHLTPIQRLNIARHPNRPTFLDHVLNITDKWVELHGDRAGYDDPAIVTGIGSIDGRTYMFIGHQKGRNTNENIQRNFGMPTPHGYRKALRMMYYADHHGFPIVTFIDTPGAFADLKSEELGQGEAIAHNLRTMFGLKVPIISIVIGEGGSGGALAIGCANKLLMLENAVFYVASPEACAAILWKSAKASPKAAEKLRITASELCKLKIADGIIPEPLGGAHADPSWTSQQIKIAVIEAMNELLEMDTASILQHRMDKFRKLGGFQEGIPVDPQKKVNMKKKEEPVSEEEETVATMDFDLEAEVEKLREQILKSKESSTRPPELGLNEMIEKLKREVDQEYLEAIRSLGLKDKLDVLRTEVAKAGSSSDQLAEIRLKDKIESLKQEIDNSLPRSPNFSSLMNKLDMLKEISKAKNLAAQDDKIISMKQNVNKKFKEVMERADVQEKIKKLKEEIENAGVSEVEDMSLVLKEKVVKVKKEIEMELSKALKDLQLDVDLVTSKTNVIESQPFYSEVVARIEDLNEEISNGIEEVINSYDLKNKIEILKLEVAKLGKSSDLDAKRKIEDMKEDIKRIIAEVLNSPEWIEKHKELKRNIEKVREDFSNGVAVSTGEWNGSLSENKDDGSKQKSKVDVDIDAATDRSFA